MAIGGVLARFTPPERGLATTFGAAAHSDTSWGASITAVNEALSLKTMDASEGQPPPPLCGPSVLVAKVRQEAAIVAPSATTSVDALFNALVEKKLRQLVRATLVASRGEDEPMSGEHVNAVRKGCGL
jgi:hypothetical protein